MDGCMGDGWMDVVDGWRGSNLIVSVLRVCSNMSVSFSVSVLTRASDGDFARQLCLLGFSCAERVPDSDAGSR